MHNIIVNTAMVFACFVIPFVVFVWPVVPCSRGSIRARWAVVGLIGWVVLAIGGKMYQLAWFHEERTTGSVPAWDPAFTMMSCYIFGWPISVIGAAPFVLVRTLVNRVGIPKASKARCA